MRQASLAIVSGLTEEFNKVVKNRIKVLSSTKKVNFGDIGKKLGSFSSFLGALSPMFSIFGGIITIITTFLTPNPFEQMVKYLEKEFDEVHRRLSYLEADIADLKKEVQSKNDIVAMAPALKAIRHTLRAYETMVKSLSNAPVCGSRNLLQRHEVVTFMDQNKTGRVEDGLKDLYGVDFGEVVEASSLLKSFMRAYCGTEVGKVQRFMQEISYYAYAGSMAHFAHRSLECQKPKKDRPTNCKTDEVEKEKWMKKLYRFLKKANAMREGAVNPAYGLQLDMQPDLDQLIVDEVKKAKNKEEFPGVLDKVYDFIITKLYDINDWPEACIVNLREDSVVIIQVAQLLSNVTVYGYDFKPWALGYKYTGVGLEKLSKFRVKNVERGFRRELVTDPYKFQPLYTEGEKSCHCQDGPKVKESCNVTAWQYSLEKIDYYKDRILYFLFNPLSYLISIDPAAKFIQHTPIVVSNIVPVCAFYKERSFLNNFCYDAEVVIACLHYLKMHEVDGKRHWYNVRCVGPDPKDPNRRQWWPEWEKYVAIVAD